MKNEAYEIKGFLVIVLIINRFKIVILYTLRFLINIVTQTYTYIFNITYYVMCINELD